MPTLLWRIELFGELAIRHGSRVVSRFETRKVGALLACLCLPLERAHPREVVAEELWPGEDRETILSRLRQTLSWLRRHLEPADTPDGAVLRADRMHISLDPLQVTTDVSEFEAALHTASREAEPAARIAALHRAVALYRGELLPGYYETGIVQARERLARAYRDALGQLAGALAEAGGLTEAIECAELMVREDPMREDAHIALMRLLASAGRNADVLRQYRELERVLREELDTAPADGTHAIMEELRKPAERVQTASVSGTQPTAIVSGRMPTAILPNLEPEGGAVPLESAFYLERPTDAEFKVAITRQDSLVLVRGPRQVGKTSLLARGLKWARDTGRTVVAIDLQQMTPEQMETPAALFEAIAELLIAQLDLGLALESVWNPRRGWNVNFDRFLRHELLARLPAPLVWGLDEVDRLFSYPYSTVVFGLFRSWHNARALNPDGPWSRLTLAMAYATEAHLFITDLNQSPFNVGTRLSLEDFTPEEVEDLNRRYHTPLHGRTEVARYYELVCGHPYLTRRGLHALATHGLTLKELGAQSAREDGIFGDHLRRLLASLVRDAGLCDAIRAVLRGQSCPDVESFYRLRSAGLLAGDSLPEARIRCGLYHTYLEGHLL